MPNSSGVRRLRMSKKKRAIRGIKRTARKVSDAVSSVGLSIAFARPVRVRRGKVKFFGQKKN